MKSIRSRLTLTLLIGILLVFALAGAATYSYARSRLVKIYDDSLIAKARALSTLVELEENGELGFEDPGMQHLPEFSRKHDPEYFQLWAGSDRVALRSISLGNRNLQYRSGNMEKPALWNMDLPDGRDGRAVGIRFSPRRERELAEGIGVFANPDGKAVLVLASEREPLDRSLAVLGAGLGIFILIFPAGTTLLVLALVNRGLRPVGLLADEAKQIDANSLDQRLSLRALPAELLPIASQVNNLLGRLEQAFSRERRFTADVAHELRTPVAELRAAAEVAQKWPDDPEAAGKFPETALQVALQMESLVGNLLQLARCQAGRVAPENEPVELGEVVRATWSPLAERAGARGLQASITVPPEITVQTDRTLLSAIVSNLLNNAVEYTPDGGTIELNASVGEKELKLRFSNSNDAISFADVASLLQPFWRKDEARTDQSHAGLGLTLASEYSRILGGSLSVAIDSLHRFVVSVQLPHLTALAES